MKRRRQFDIKNDVITNIKPYEIVAIIVSKLKIFGEGNTRDRETQAFLPMYWYANSKEEAARIAEDEIYNEEGSEIGIYELKKIGSVYIPEPKVVIEWE